MFWQFFPGYCSHCTIPIHHCKLSRVSIYQTLRTVHTMFCFFWYYVNQDHHQRGGVAFSFGPWGRRTCSRGPDVHNVCLYLALHGTNTACALFLLWTVFQQAQGVFTHIPLVLYFKGKCFTLVMSQGAGNLIKMEPRVINPHKGCVPLQSG